MMKILVTGGAGFIGSHLCERFLSLGHAVTILDNFNDFYDPAIKRNNLAGLSAAQVVEGDIRDRDLLKRVFADEQFDAVVHLAAMAGVRPSLKDPLLYEDVNVRGTLALLEEVRQRPEMRFVLASSSSVYGGNESVPFKETDDISRPVSPYAATKRAAELMAYTHQHLYGNPITCLRFFTVYGPRQRPEMAIHRFVAATLAGESIPFFGDGTTRRDYTFVDDIIDGVVRATERCEGYEIYNLGESATTTLAELVEEVGRACDREVLLDRQPMQPGDVEITYADVTKAREKLGYRPSTTVRAGLARFVDWYRSVHSLH